MVETKFKYTDIGFIPEDWEVTSIGDFSVIRTGAKNTQDKIENGQYPFFVRSQKVENINSYCFDGEAVLTAGDGVGVGKVFHYINDKFDFHQRVYAISNFRKDVDGFYFFKYFQNNFLNRIMQMTAKSSVDSVRMETIANMQIPLPPLPEQQAIAEVLSDTDNWIESLEKLITKKQLIKQGAMQQLLTPREGWKINRLGNFVGFQTGFPFSSEYFNTKNKGLRLVKNRDLRSDDSIVYYSGDYPKDYLVNKGELLIGMDGDFEPILWKKDIALLNQRVGRVVPKKQISIPFLSFILVKKLKEIESSAGSTTVKHLSHSDVEQIELELPKYEEQTRIAIILSDMDAEIETLKQKLAKAKQIKQGLMQELLTGRIRLV